ncbi:hypothetical protein [Nonomuraea sp. CA-141351]
MAVVTRVLDFRPDTSDLPGPLGRLVSAALDRDPVKSGRPPGSCCREA